MVLTSSFRSDIQALRALSVAAVVLYHAGFMLPGGYLGVDVFFVISGFLVARILLTEFETSGSIKLSDFYRRRISRLAPAFVVVTLSTLLLLYFVVGPISNPNDAALTAIGAVLLSANVVTAITNADYFNSAENAFLHYWSLGVEEQFYLFFPILFLVLLRFTSSGRKRYHWLERVFWLLAIVSFLLALIPEKEIFEASWVQVLLGFYSPVVRLWEFALGILALFLSRRICLSSSTNAVVSLLGFAFIILSFLAIPSSGGVPGTSTLLPTLGAAMVICVGAPWLRWSPLMWLGRWSYSLYLWHWPLIFISKIIWPGSTSHTVFAILLSVVLSGVTEQFLEKRYRKPGCESQIRTRREISALVATALVFSVQLYFFGPRFWGLLEDSGVLITNAGEIGSVEYYREIDNLFFPCINEVFVELAPVRYGYSICFQSKREGNPSVLVIGDSHADHLLAGLASELPSRNVGAVVTNAFRDRVFDSERFDQILHELESDKTLEVVILSAFWGDPDQSASTRFSLAELDRIESRLNLAGKQVLLAVDVNHFDYHPSRCKYPKTLFSDPPKKCDGSEISSEKAFELTQWAAVNGIGIINPRLNMCLQGTCLMLSEDGKLLYRDFHHLTIEGSRVALKNQLGIVEDFAVR